MPDNGETILNIARKIGYRVMDAQIDAEYNIVRNLRGEGYPRFHIYIKKDKENKNFLFNLHLDQKFPSYKQSKAHRHSGEYDGDVVEKEAERIKNILSDGKKDFNKERVFKF